MAVLAFAPQLLAHEFFMLAVVVAAAELLVVLVALVAVMAAVMAQPLQMETANQIQAAALVVQLLHQQIQQLQWLPMAVQAS
jgi:hypothetical protein